MSGKKLQTKKGSNRNRIHSLVRYSPPFTHILLSISSSISIVITQRSLRVLNPTEHRFYNLNRCHSRRIRRQGPHTEQISTPLVLPNERRNRDRLSIGRGLLSFRLPALLVPPLRLRDSFRALCRRSSSVCLTSFLLVFIEVSPRQEWGGCALKNRDVLRSRASTLLAARVAKAHEPSR